MNSNHMGALLRIIVAVVALVPLLVIFTAVDGYTTKDHPDYIMHHSLNPPLLMDWWEGGLPYWDFGGHTVVTDSYIRLTPDRESRHGWLWNEYPIDLESWHVRLGFRVHGKGKFGADGFALWYVEHPSRASGPIFGMTNHFNGVGFIFDTYDNNADRDTPAISLISNDGTFHRFNTDNDLRNDALGRCALQLRNRNVEVDIIYDSKRITLAVAVGAAEPYECFSVSDIELPPKFYFGLTSVTGQVTDNHDIEFFEFYPLSGIQLDHDPYEIDGQEEFTEDQFIDPVHPPQKYTDALELEETSEKQPVKTPPSQQQVPPTQQQQQQVPPTYQQPPIQQQVPPNYQQPPSQQQVPPTYQQPPSQQQQQQVPPTYQQPPTQQQVPPTYQQPPTQQQVPPTYQQPPTQQQVPPIYQQPPTQQQVPPTYQQPTGQQQYVPPTQQQQQQVPPTYQQPTTQQQVPPTYQQPTTQQQVPPTYQQPTGQQQYVPPSHQQPTGQQQYVPPSHQQPTGQQQYVPPTYQQQQYVPPNYQQHTDQPPEQHQPQ